MNYYEQIQTAIDYMEERLDQDLSAPDIARAAALSQAGLYRLFFALTGYQVIEYLRLRRLSEATKELMEGNKTVLAAAMDWGFASPEVFTRALKRVSGHTPSALCKSGLRFCFERMDIMDKYFEVQDRDLLEKYPDIKVLKELAPCRIASCHFTGRDPETGAWNLMSRWLKRDKVDLAATGMRFFGFNNPDPQPGQAEYGYEVWATIRPDMEIDHPDIKVKDFSGGLYAVTGVRGGTDQIAPTWQRFIAWLRDSRYTWGGHQWLEEHMGFDAEYHHTGSMDLYMPIAPKPESEGLKQLAEVPDRRVICLHKTGKRAEAQAKKEFADWADR